MYIYVYNKFKLQPPQIAGEAAQQPPAPRNRKRGERIRSVTFCRKICWSFRKRYPTGQYRSPPARPVTSNSAKRAFAYSGFLRPTDIVQPAPSPIPLRSLYSWPTRYTRDAHVGEFTRAPVSGRPVIQIIFCGLVGVRARVRVRACACAFATTAAVRACGWTVNWNRRTGRMAPMSKGVLNPFLRSDNRRGSDSGRFDSIKGVVTIACSVKVACKRLFKASFSLFLLLFLSVRRKKRNISLLFISIYSISYRIFIQSLGEFSIIVRRVQRKDCCRAASQAWTYYIWFWSSSNFD